MNEGINRGLHFPEGSGIVVFRRAADDVGHSFHVHIAENCEAEESNFKSLLYGVPVTAIGVWSPVYQTSYCPLCGQPET